MQQKITRQEFEDLHKKADSRSCEIAEALGPANEECRISVCIPVAGHEEGANLTRTLESFRAQQFDAEQAEIVLFINHPSGKSSERTIEPLRSFLATSPISIPVRYAVGSLDSDEQRIGYIRKVLHDAVAIRVGDPDWRKQHIMLRTDADTCEVSPNWLNAHTAWLQGKALNNRALSGRLKSDRGLVASCPLLMFADDVNDVASEIATGGQASGGGANFSMTTAEYLSYGGYHPLLTKAEDVELGRRILNIPGLVDEGEIIITGGEDSTLWTSARRSMECINRGYAPIWQWSLSQMEFSTENPDVRTKNEEIPRYDLNNFMRELDPLFFDVEADEILLETIEFWEGAKRAVSSIPDFRQQVAKRLGLIVDFDERCQIKNIELLRASLLKRAEDMCSVSQVA